MRKREPHLVGHAPGDLDVLLLEGVGLSRVEDEPAGQLSFEADRDAEAGPDPVLPHDLALCGSRIGFLLDVADDLEIPVGAQALGVLRGELEGGRKPRHPLAGVSQDAHFGLLVVQEAESEPVVRKDLLGDRGNLVEDLSHVQRLREGRDEGFERFVSAAPLALGGGMPRVRERHADEVGDRRELRLVLRGERRRGETEHRKVAEHVRAAVQPRAQHRMDSRGPHLAVAWIGVVQHPEEVVVPSHARQDFPEPGGVLGPGHEARISAPEFLRERFSADRVELEAFGGFERHRHRIETDDASGGVSDLLEHFGQVERLCGHAGNLRQDFDEVPVAADGGGRRRDRHRLILGSWGRRPVSTTLAPEWAPTPPFPPWPKRFWPERSPEWRGPSPGPKAATPAFPSSSRASGRKQAAPASPASRARPGRGSPR